MHSLLPYHRVYPANKRVTDGARTRDLLSATIRTHGLVVVCGYAEIRINKPCSRITRSLMVAYPRLGCRRNCRQIGMYPNVVPETLNHFSIVITLTTYSHMLAALRSETTVTMEDAPISFGLAG
jgi:hypothetical protein